jgi:hypothetical protein
MSERASDVEGKAVDIGCNVKLILHNDDLLMTFMELHILPASFILISYRRQ